MHRSRCGGHGKPDTGQGGLTPDSAAGRSILRGTRSVLTVGILTGMTESPRPDAPAAVEKLWATIEAYCEDRTGKRRLVRRIAQRTGLSRSTISDWFNYRSFPQWEAF